VERRLAAVLAADAAGYSRLMGGDEEGTLARLKAVRKTLVDPKIEQHRGRIVKTTGDGLLVEFASAVDAARCAVEIQSGVAKQNAGVPKDKQIEFRIGIHVGDIIFDENDIFGDGVNIAARLEGIAEPGGICISDDAQRQIRGKVDITFEDMGPQELKNIAEPMRAWRMQIDPSVSSIAAAKLSPGPPQSLALPDKPSIAVLPFQNMSGDPEQEYFADGMVEDIITALSRFKSMFVIARNSSFTYKGKAVDIRQVGRELGVRYVLEGSVRKSGNRVRITGQLIEASSDAHLWADRFEGSLEDVFDLQDQVASAVVGAMDPRIVEAEIARIKRKPPNNLDAYDCFLRGSDLCSRWSADANQAALRLFYRAIELDPEYAPAYAYACWCHVFRSQLGTDFTPEQRRETARLAHEAARLGRDDAFSLVWAGWSLAMLGELSEGARLVDRALALNPNMARIWNLSGWVRIWLRQPEVAIQHFERAMRLDPLDPFMHAVEDGMAYAHIRTERYNDAVSWAKRALQSKPNDGNAARAIAIGEAMSGRFDEARIAVRRFLEINPDARISTHAPLIHVSDEFQARITEALRKAGMPE
jgi:TolB-like protein/class 3 adenylate cyclase/tetratricopeptide (TPR) repeat protein